MENQKMYVSNAEAAIRLSVIDDRNWVSWLADDRRKCNSHKIIPYIKTPDRRVWYDPVHLNIFISKVKQNSRPNGRTNLFRQKEVMAGTPFITTREINGETHIEILGLASGDTFTFSDAHAFAVELVSCLKEVQSN
ncbi:MAG: hypothetical protein AB2603_12010 [Candidatus Thiodiazotropha endolucinida]